ncbi:hypothetical protein OAH18_02860, partial [bacterium]|nr:hypothetical protein [bacterium]
SAGVSAYEVFTGDQIGDGTLSRILSGVSVISGGINSALKSAGNWTVGSALQTADALVSGYEIATGDTIGDGSLSGVLHVSSLGVNRGKTLFDPRVSGLTRAQVGLNLATGVGSLVNTGDEDLQRALRSISIASSLMSATSQLGAAYDEVVELLAPPPPPPMPTPVYYASAPRTGSPAGGAPLSAFGASVELGPSGWTGGDFYLADNGQGLAANSAAEFRPPLGMSLGSGVNSAIGSATGAILGGLGGFGGSAVLADAVSSTNTSVELSWVTDALIQWEQMPLAHRGAMPTMDEVRRRNQVSFGLTIDNARVKELVDAGLAVKDSRTGEKSYKAHPRANMTYGETPYYEAVTVPIWVDGKEYHTVYARTSQDIDEANSFGRNRSQIDSHEESPTPWTAVGVAPGKGRDPYASLEALHLDAVDLNLAQSRQRELEGVIDTLTIIPGGSAAKVIVYSAAGEDLSISDYVFAALDVVPVAVAGGRNAVKNFPTSRRGSLDLGAFHQPHIIANPTPIRLKAGQAQARGLVQSVGTRTTGVSGRAATAVDAHATKIYYVGIETTQQLSDGEYRGGSHRAMSGPATRGDGLDSHHMPDRGADTGVHPNDGPAIQMDPRDHWQTTSNGRNGRAGIRYRAETREMIENGQYRDAMAREIHDVRRAATVGSGDATKYNQATREMLDYARSSGQLPAK